jgi:hypothetical protein
MNLKIRYIIPVLILLGSGIPGFGQQAKKNDVLVLFTDNVTHEHGYKNSKGEIAIPSGKYMFCFTDTFKTYAIVTIPKKGFVAIDRKENIL